MDWKLIVNILITNCYHFYLTCNSNIIESGTIIQTNGETIKASLNHHRGRGEQNTKNNIENENIKIKNKDTKKLNKRNEQIIK